MRIYFSQDFHLIRYLNVFHHVGNPCKSGVRTRLRPVLRALQAPFIKVTIRANLEGKLVFEQLFGCIYYLISNLTEKRV